MRSCSSRTLSSASGSRSSDYQGLHPAPYLELLDTSSSVVSLEQAASGLPLRGTLPPQLSLTRQVGDESLSVIASSSSLLHIGQSTPVRPGLGKVLFWIYWGRCISWGRRQIFLSSLLVLILGYVAVDSFQRCCTDHLLIWSCTGPQMLDKNYVCLAQFSLRALVLLPSHPKRGVLPVPWKTTWWC